MERESMEFDVVIVGAGPAGLSAAEHLAGAGHKVAVYDRMPSVARKLLIAGRGPVRHPWDDGVRGARVLQP